MLKQIRAEEVQLGMFVRRFEGSWLKHPFWWPRFVIRTEKQLARIRDSDVIVVIDTDKGVDAAPAPAPAAAKAAPELPPAPLLRLHRAEPAPLPMAKPVAPAKKIVAPKTFGKADKVRANALAQRSTKVVKALFEDCQLGRAVPVGQILTVVDDITTTLEQNASAFLSVTRLKSKDDGTYTHSIAVCALMIGLARELGAFPAEVQALGTAGLLHDIGKVGLADDVLHKDGELSAQESAEMRRHPELGHALLLQEAGLPAVVLDVCLNHHERLDGSGYPHALREDKLTRAVRMAMICDAYEQLTSNGPSGAKLAPVDAITVLQASGTAFDAPMLFKFMRSIGVFPAKKLVRLRSNRLGVVLPSQGEDRRPTVRTFYSTIETRFTDYAEAVLSDSFADDQAVSEEEPARWFEGDWDAMLEAIMTAKPLTPALIGGKQASAA